MDWDDYKIQLVVIGIGLFCVAAWLGASFVFGLWPFVR